MSKVVKNRDPMNGVRQQAAACGIDNVCDDSDCLYRKSKWECLINSNKLECIYYSGKPKKARVSTYSSWDIVKNY